VPSIQDRHDHREIALDRVGIVDLVYPVTVPERGGGTQTTEALIGLFVGLPHSSRGAHMSRFVEILEAHEEALTAETLGRLVEKLRGTLGAESAQAEIEFTFFVRKNAPVSGSGSLLACRASLEASVDSDGSDLVLTVEVPVLTVCPCSIESTGGPAHSQRGHVTASVRVNGHVWIEELVELIEDSASAPVFALIKGEDERAILEEAYERPVFVEDLVRNVAERLDSDVRFPWYSVEAENLESVHDHNVYASVERSR
jgi:GTP cyclohydrolase I